MGAWDLTIALKFGTPVDNTPANASTKLQNDIDILAPNFAPPKLSRPYDKTPGVPMQRAITWTNVDQVLGHYMCQWASMGHTKSIQLSPTGELLH